MIWKIAKKEFLLNLMTFKFGVGTILCLVLMAVFMPVLVTDYRQRLKDYNENVAANEAELRKVKAYRNITPTVYRPPNVLSIFSEKIDKQLESPEKIGIHGDSESGMETSQTNHLLSVFPVLDVTLIFKIAVSVLALLMAYDVISSEREQGTLRLILSNTIARHKVLLGKLVAGLMTLIVPVTALFIVGLLVILLSGTVSLTGSDWFRIGLMYLASLIFISVMFNLGLLLSCLSNTSATSLVLGLFLWVFLAVIVPNAGAYIASQAGQIESREEFYGKVEAVMEQREDEIDELTEDIEGGGSQSNAPDAFGHVYVMLCNKGFMEYHLKRYPITEPVELKYRAKVLDLQQSRLNDLMRQKRLADNIARISPIILFENLMSVLAGTDFENLGCFKNNVRAYGNEVIDYIRSRTEDFTSTAYFTPSKEADWQGLMKLYQPYTEAKDEAEKAKLMKVVGEWYNRRIEETPSLNLQDFPRFICQPQSITRNLQRAIPDLALLIFMNLLFFALSFVAFLRYGVG